LHGGEGTIGFLLARAVSFVEELVQAVEYKLVDAVGVVQYQLEYPDHENIYLAAHIAAGHGVAICNNSYVIWH